MSRQNHVASELSGQKLLTTRILRRAFQWVPKRGSFWYGFERTRLGTEIGFGDSKNWYPWRLFDIVAAAPALPNHFMAFAPNNRSYHAVRMNIPESSEGRRVIRGFIRSGIDQKNFIALDKPAA